MGRSRRIQNRRERAESDLLEIALRKRRGRRIQNRRERAESDLLKIALRKRRGRKEQRKKGVGDRNKTVFLFDTVRI
jgi:hypothetical protein